MSVAKRAEKFLEKVKSKHNHFYNYSNTHYQRAMTAVKIICPLHGEFYQLPAVHLRGHGCPLCGKIVIGNKGRTSLADYISKCNKIHEDKFDYSLVKFKNLTESIRIICPKHGEFKQNSGTHLKGAGCIKCANEDKTLNVKDFIIEATEVHGDKYDYSKVDYKGSLSKVIIICKLHGEFTQQAYMHKKGQGCRQCGSITLSNSLRKSQEKFIEECVKIHGESYSYGKVIYRKHTEKVTITCKIHGDFEQLASNHLAGKGCIKCSHLTDKVGFTRSDFIGCSKSGKAYLYVIRCVSESEEFLKIGITTKEVKDRFYGKHAMPYKYEVIHTICDSPGEIYSMEKSLFRLFNKSDKYTPLINFGGKSECYKSYVLSTINKFINEV